MLPLYFKKRYAGLSIIAVILTSFLLNVTMAEDGPPTSGAMQSGPITALTQSPMDIIPGGMEGKVSLDLRNIDVVDALKFLAMKAGANIIATKNVAGRITLLVENVPVKDIFDIMLRSNGLAYARHGNIYNVMTEEEYKALYGKKFSDIRQVKVVRLKYAIPDQAFSMLDVLKSDIGRVLVEPDSGTALIMDTPDRIKEIEMALESLEEKNLVKVYNLKYAKAKDIEEQLKTQLDGKKVGSIKADERSNQLIVQTLPDRMADIDRLVEALDAKTKEVLIDTKIIKVKLSDDMTEGIEWEGLANLGGQLGMMYLGSYPFSIMQTATTAAATALPDRLQFYDANQDRTGVGSYPFSGNTTSNLATATQGGKVAPGERLHVGLVSRKKDLDAVIKYLQTLGKTQILSSPQLAVINNQEARIHVGERQAYVTTTTTTGQATSTVSEEVTFVDVGIQLAVTPTINDDGYITMKVKPEISSVVDTLLTPSNNRIPIIDTSMAETTVMVKDGATIIIGGMRKEEKVSASDQVPYLGKIPILGFLFRSGTNNTERTELLIMMTPHIVSGDRLFTGDDRDFHDRQGKDYRDYKGMTDESDYKPSKAAVEERMKPYTAYRGLHEEEERLPGIKGEKDE